MPRSFDIFAETDLRKTLQARRATAISDVQQENEDYLLNANETDYISYLVEKHRTFNLDCTLAKIGVLISKRPLRARL